MRGKVFFSPSAELKLSQPDRDGAVRVRRREEEERGGKTRRKKGGEGQRVSKKEKQSLGGRGSGEEIRETEEMKLKSLFPCRSH